MQERGSSHVDRAGHGPGNDLSAAGTCFDRERSAARWRDRAGCRRTRRRRQPAWHSRQRPGPGIRRIPVAGPGPAADPHRRLSRRGGDRARAGCPGSGGSGCVQATDRIRQHAVALQHEPERQEHDRGRVQRVDEGARRARCAWCGRVYACTCHRARRSAGTRPAACAPPVASSGRCRACVAATTASG